LHTDTYFTLVADYSGVVERLQIHKIVRTVFFSLSL